jgi:peptide chain release factor subunit 1
MTTETTSRVPPTTRLGPDLVELMASMRRVAKFESANDSFLSVYLDFRPEAHGERPYARADLVLIRDRLDEIVSGLAAHAPARRSLEADRLRLNTFLDAVAPSSEGVAAFACSGVSAWETVELGTPFETDLAAGRFANLYQLMLAIDAEAPAIIALADSTSCRLFTRRRGTLVERGGPEDDPQEHRRHDQGGWSQARFQRHIDEQDRRFAARVAEWLTGLADAQHAQTVLIAADDRTSAVLLPQLPDRVRALLVDVRHISMHATRDEVEAEVGPLLDALTAQRATSIADRALAGHQAKALGVAGVEPVRAMLAAGAVAELVIDQASGTLVGRWDRAALVRSAVLTDATITFPRGHEGLLAGGGVAATLRYRPAT